MKSENLEITQLQTLRGTKFVLKGHINSINAPELEEKLTEALNGEGRNIILNMLRVEYLSSAGIKVIIKAFKDAQKAGRKLGIEGPSENVRNVLGITALDKLLIK